MDLLEVTLTADVKVIAETLSRIGIANKKDKILYPSCYLYDIGDKYYIAHFKQIFTLTREDAFDNMLEEDYARRNGIAFLLRQWGLIEVEDDKIEDRSRFVFVLPYPQKKDWKISHKVRFSRNFSEV